MPRKANVRRNHAKRLFPETLEARCLLAGVEVGLLPAEDIQLRAATIGFELSDIGGSEPNVSLYWGDEDAGTLGNAWDDVIAFGSSAVGQYTQEVTDLLPNHTYYYRAFALSFTDGPTWSETASFQTLPPQAATIDVGPLRNVSGTGFDVSGTITDDGGDPPKVIVYFDTENGGDDPANWSNSVEIEPIESSFAATVSGLLPNTQYFVRVAATNASGPGWGPTEQIQTANIAPLRISEFMSANSSTFATRVRTDIEARYQRGDQAYDWIEVQNALTEPVDVSGYHLTDNRSRPTKWAFPDGTVIPASGRIVVYASGFDFTDPQHDDNGILHTNFSISRQGEYLALTDPAGNVLHEIRDFPEQAYDTSYGYFGNFLGTFRSPTPGAPNSPLGPAVTDVTHTWANGNPADQWTVAARVTPSLYAIESVQLAYRVMFEDEIIVEMSDDGMGPDLAADDGIYTATIPGGIAQPGQMVRYYVAATDTNQLLGRAPLFAKPETTPEYFGTMIADNSIDTQLPVLHRFVEQPNRANAVRGTRASVFYDGEFYDNVYLRSRGGTAQSWPKKAFKFEFNDDHHFEFRDGVPRVDEINVNTTYTDKSYVRAILTSELQLDAGTPSPESFHLRMNENGEFFSVAIFVEQPDRDFLRRHGHDPDGSYYKGGPGSTYVSSTGSFEKKTRDYEDKSDLDALIDGLHTEGDELEQFIFDNVNLPAQINFMATNVITQNIDASDKNHYLYRDTNGTGEWHMLPWDLDLTFGPDALNTNLIVSDENTRGASNPTAVHPLLGGRDFPLHVGKINDLLDRLIKNPRTHEMLLRRIRTLSDEYLGTEYFQTRIDELVSLIANDVVEDREKWGNQAHFGGRTLPLEEEGARIKDEYLARRYPYLTEYHVNGGVGIPQAQPADAVVQFGDAIEYRSEGNSSAEYFTLSNPNVYAVDLSGWTISGEVTATLAAGTVIPAGDVLYLTANVPAFRARTLGPSGSQGLFVQGYDGELADDAGSLVVRDKNGAEVASTTYGAAPIQRANSSNLKITEINYHPAETITQFGELAVGASEFEFIEVMNVSAEPIELDQTTFGDGIDFVFAAQQLGPGDRLVVVANAEAFVSRYGSDVPIATGYRDFATGFSSRLANDGEPLALYAADGELIEALTYGDNRGWPTRADGRGSSLERLTIDSDGNRPGGWQASSDYHGSPGSDNSEPVRNVVINEIMSRTIAPNVDQIELFNPTDQPIDLSGWYLTDNGAEPTKFAIPAMAVDAGSYVTFDQNQLGFGFSGDEADDAWLIAGDESGRPTRFVDVVEFPETPVGRTRGRWPNGTGEFVLASEPTIGFANSTPATDLNNDMAVDVNDVDILCSAIANRAADQSFDLNADASVDIEDMRYLIEMVLQTNFGDANLDGRFDTRDLVTVFSAAEFEDSITGNSTWAEGDWNCDGDATTRDLVLAFQSGTYGEFAVARTSQADFTERHHADHPDKQESNSVEKTAPKPRTVARKTIATHSSRVDTVFRLDAFDVDRPHLGGEDAQELDEGLLPHRMK